MSDFIPFEESFANKEIIDAYGGELSASASHRSFIDIQPNISVRTALEKRDYYRFREGEAIPDDSKRAIKMCMEAYDKVGIIKNVIDLMGDFASQGITLTHQNKKIQKIYRSWWKSVRGVERSERFLNTLYRCGNVVVRRRYAKPSKKMRTEMSQAFVKDMVDIPSIKTDKYTIPYRYDILNPTQISVKGGEAGIFFGRPKYLYNISTLLRASLKEEGNRSIFETLPDSIKQAINNDKKELELEEENLRVFHYKKDDWQLWANPMVYAILDDIVMFEKMKLADSAALDGAISNVRLWTIGSLEHKITPQKPAIDRLRNILASNVGGGTMDLVWGPELQFKESATQIYKFLGNEKYEPVLSSIYAGLGIPPSLTGVSQSGGFTNNFVSLKTLIDRLEYGRSLLQEFWDHEIRIFQKAMGFSTPAKLHFDFMLLSDETAERNLLMGLADRGYISIETLRDRINEDNDLENVRTMNEHKARLNKKSPPFANPFHNANVDSELMKIALQKGFVGVKDVLDIEVNHAPPLNVTTPKPSAPNGRPKFANDTKPRKPKEVKPKTKPNMTMGILWANKAQKLISELIQPAMFAHFNKANLRDLTKDERQLLSNIEMSVLSNLEPLSEVTPESVLAANKPINKDFENTFNSVLRTYTADNGQVPSLEDIKQIISLSYILTFCE